MTEIPREFPLPEEAAQRQRSLLGAHIGAGRRSSRTTRRGVVAVAAVILVGGLLVTPALGIGGRLLALIESPPGRPEVQAPVWSPDGRRIAFLNKRDGGKEIYVVSADGSGQRRLTRDARFSATPAWSPDGRKIAFEGGPRRHLSGVYVVNADGSGQRRLARNGSAPAWSPDGRTIAFFSDSKIYLMNADGSEHRPLTKPTAGAEALSCVVARRAEARLPQRGRLRPVLLQPLCRQQRRERTAEPDVEAGRRRSFWCRSRVRSCLVARRAEDRIRATQRRPRGTDLRREGRRQRAAEPDAEAGGGLRRSCLVARRAEDRLRQRPRRQLRGLRHERQRQRATEPDAQPGVRRRSRLVARRAEDRLRQQPRRQLRRSTS